MYFGYNTNGMAHHALFDAVALLAEIGYEGVAITIDHGALPPAKAGGGRRIERLRDLLERLQMRSVIETGARFLLDPRRKHEPTLVSPDPAGRRRRIDFYKYAIDCAAWLGSGCVSLWSGPRHDGVSQETATQWLLAGLKEVVAYASWRGVAVGFEPEPGMLVASVADYDALVASLVEQPLQLTLDIGHLHCQGEVPIEDIIRRCASRLVNVHIEDMRRGVHEHLMFGEGEIQFPPILRALADVGYTGGVYVELSRHSYQAPETASQALAFLRRCLPRSETR